MFSAVICAFYKYIAQINSKIKKKQEKLFKWIYFVLKFWLKKVKPGKLIFKEVWSLNISNGIFKIWFTNTYIWVLLRKYPFNICEKEVNCTIN